MNPTPDAPTLWRILFLCTGNSCGSQMAEGWARARQAASPEEALEVDRRVRDEIRDFVRQLPELVNQRGGA